MGRWVRVWASARAAERAEGIRLPYDPMSYPRDCIRLAVGLPISDSSYEKVGAELRAMMPWIGKKKLIDSDKK